MRPRTRFALAVILFTAAAIVVVSVLPRAPLDANGHSHHERRLAALRTYAGRVRQGSFVPQTDALLSIRESFLQRVIDGSLPVRRYFEQGRYVARLDSATVRLESGVALVRIGGRGMVAGQEDSPFYADLLLEGVVAITGVDPTTGTLRASLVITDVRTRRSRSRRLQGWLSPVGGYFGHLKAEDWNRTRQRIFLPLRIDREILLPGIDGDISVPESRVSLSVRVSAVTTLDQRIAVSLALRPDLEDGEPAMQADSLWNLERPDVPPVAAAAPRLRFHRPRSAEEDTLRARVERLAYEDPLWRAVASSDDDVVAVIPRPLLSRVIARASHRYLTGVRVDIRPEARIKVDSVLRMKILGDRMGVGRLKGLIHITHLQGQLAVSGTPRVVLEPPDELVITAPVEVRAGRGAIGMEMAWDPAMLVSLVCRGFQFRESLTGDILPVRDTLTTRMRFAVEDSNVVCRPRVPRDTLRMKADLDIASWNKVRQKLVEQDRFGRCGLVMNADSVLVALKRLAQAGMNLRLPPKVFKPFLLPVSLERSYVAEAYQVAARAYSPTIAVEREFVRLGFRVDLRVRPLAIVPEAPPVPPQTTMTPREEAPESSGTRVRR